MRFLGGVGVFAVGPAAVVLAVEVEAERSADLETAAGDMGCGGQPVVEPHRAQIGDVADVAIGLGHEQQDRLAVEVGLLIGGYPDLVVVAHLQPELYLGDLGLGKFRLVEKTRTVEVVN